MTQYMYRAVHPSGRISRGEMTAANENELGHYLSQSGLELIDAQEIRTKTVHSFLGPRKIHPRYTAAFFSRMHDLLESNISFPEALREMHMTTDNRILADALAQISRSIANGKGIAASFALYPHLFPSLFVALIGAGETSGDMKSVFRFLSRHAAHHAQTHDRLRRALRYPLFLFLVAGGAVAFMMTMVIPQVIQFLTGLEGHIPFATRVLVFASGIFTQYSGAALWLAGFILIASYGAYKFSPPFSLLIDQLFLRLPVIGSVILKTSLARFANSFSLLFRSGCDVPQCLRQAAETVRNRALRQNIEDAETRVIAGSSLSTALGGVLPSYALGVLRTGERSGDLGKSLDDIAVAYDREAMDSMDSFIGMLEPCLTLIIGAILAWTVLAVLGPLYGSLSILGRRM